MTRVEDLTLKSADDCLRPSEVRELHSLLEADSQAAREHLALLSLEAALRASRKDFDLCDSILARLERERAESIEAKVLSQIQFEALPKWHPRSRRLSFLPGRVSGVLALAAGIVLLVSLGVWFFGPTMGEPILASVNGTEVSIERGTEFIPASSGTRLQPADVLSTGKNGAATIAFGKEKTTIELAAETELKFSSFTRGKRLQLPIGQLTASVARQRPFQPMIVATPQAQARVLGTRFALVARTNATRLEVSQGTVRLTRASDGASVKVRAGNYMEAQANADFRRALPATGRILHEVWTNYTGEFLALMTSGASAADHPEQISYLTQFEAVTKIGNHYGQRLRGYIHPPVTGDYQFSLVTSGVGDSHLFLSPDDKPENMVQITADDTTARGTLTGPPPLSIPLVAGRRYYIEVLHESQTDEGGVTVRWQGPGRAREVIPGEFLSPYPVKEKKDKR